MQGITPTTGSTSMISGILISLLLLGHAHEGELDLAGLLDALAAEPVAEVGFTEFRRSELLVDDLEVSGTLRRDKRGRLVREIHAPEAETQILSASHVEVHRADGRQRRFRLQRAPELEVLYHALNGIFSADAAALSEHFDTTIEGDLAAWRLVLQPRADQLAESVQRLTVCGSDARILQFSLHLADGEITRTRIHAAP